MVKYDVFQWAVQNPKRLTYSDTEQQKSSKSSHLETANVPIICLINDKD